MPGELPRIVMRRQRATRVGFVMPEMVISVLIGVYGAVAFRAPHGLALGHGRSILNRDLLPPALFFYFALFDHRLITAGISPACQPPISGNV
jgi:hypothetical protein